MAQKGALAPFRAMHVTSYGECNLISTNVRTYTYRAPVIVQERLKVRQYMLGEFGLCMVCGSGMCEAALIVPPPPDLFVHEF
jgi:hypothetical protein